MLERRRRAFASLDEIRARTKPPSGPHDTAGAILEAVREEFGARLLDYLPPQDSVG
jgi:predicted nucleic acid-binding OB-fold protein